MIPCAPADIDSDPQAGYNEFVKEGTMSMLPLLPFSKTGFFAGATLALAAGLVKIFFLSDGDEAVRSDRDVHETLPVASGPAAAGR